MIVFVKGGVVDIREKLRQEEEARTARKKQNAETRVERMKEWRTDNPDKVRDGVLKRLYGMTLEEYDELLLNQHGRCAICGTDTPGGKGRFDVDHDHKTGKTRGLLCHKCNLAVSNHSAEFLRRCADYVEAWEE